MMAPKTAGCSDLEKRILEISFRNLPSVCGSLCTRPSGQKQRYVPLLLSPWAKYQSISTVKPDEQNYVLSANEDVEMVDVENDDEEEEEVLSELDPDEGIVFWIIVTHLISSDINRQRPAMRKSMKKMKCHKLLLKGTVIHSSQLGTRVTDPMLFVETISESSIILLGAASSIMRPSVKLQRLKARNSNQRMCAQRPYCH